MVPRQNNNNVKHNFGGQTKSITVFLKYRLFSFILCTCHVFALFLCLPLTNEKRAVSVEFVKISLPKPYPRKSPEPTPQCLF